jgi:uncharacterized protein YggE
MQSGVMLMRNLAILAVLVALFGTYAEAATPESKTITVAGFATLKIVPDHAQIDVGVDTSDKVTVKAVAANSQLMAKVVDAIKAVGISEKALQTSRFSIQAVHPVLKDGYSPDLSVTLAYAVSNTLTIDVDEVAKVPLIIDAAVKAGANTSNSVMFEVKNRQSLDDKVLADAVKDARHNAEIMAAAEGTKVGKVLVMNNTGGFPDYAMGGALNRASAMRLEAPIIMPGLVNVSASVTVVFSLE